jgi:hypothetical protein
VLLLLKPAPGERLAARQMENPKHPRDNHAQLIETARTWSGRLFAVGFLHFLSQRHNASKAVRAGVAHTPALPRAG